MALGRTEALPFGVQARVSIRAPSEGLSVVGSVPGSFTQQYSGRGEPLIDSKAEARESLTRSHTACLPALYSDQRTATAAAPLLCPKASLPHSGP